MCFCLGVWKVIVIYYYLVIILDEVYFKVIYKGVYLGLSCVDGEGYLVLIVFGSVLIENIENWMWFCVKVVEVIFFFNLFI